MSEGNMFEGIGETIEFEIGALDKLFYGANQEYIERQKRFEDGTYTEDDLINHYPRFGIETKDKIELELVESKYFDRLASLYTNLKEIEKSHKEENGKLRVELEQEKEKNKELTKQLNGAFDRGFISKNKIREKIEQTKKVYEEEMKPYQTEYGLDVTYLSKKEKDELINKRNCLLTQIKTYEMLLEEK